jgi:hypothetical protein
MLDILLHTLPDQLTLATLAFMFVMMAFMFFYVMSKVKEATK